MDAFRMMEAPSGSSGSAFCTVNRSPFTLMSKIESYSSSVSEPSGAYFATPAFANTMSSVPFSRPMCAKRRSIAEVRHVSAYTGHVAADLLYCRRHLRITAPRDEDVGAFVHEPLRRRQADAASAAGDECNLPVELAHIFPSHAPRRTLSLAAHVSVHPPAPREASCTSTRHAPRGSVPRR